MEWILTKPGINNNGWMAHILQPGWNFNPLAFVLSALVAMLLLGGVKESKNVTNYFTVLKMMGIVIITLTGVSLFDIRNLTPFLPPTLGVNGFFHGSTLSFMGYLGFDEVCCLTAKAMDLQKNMPQAIMWTIAILTISYMTGDSYLLGYASLI
ncbi:hypothetical protein ACHAXH_009527 [Discostella pseudostelligera]